MKQILSAGPVGAIVVYLLSPLREVWHLGIVPIRALVLVVVGSVSALIGDRRLGTGSSRGGVTYGIAVWAAWFTVIGGGLHCAIVGRHKDVRTGAPASAARQPGHGG